MKYEFSRSLNGKRVIHLARDVYGNVRFRAESLEELERAIRSYELEVEKKQQAALAAQQKKKRLASKKKGLKNKLKAAVVQKLSESDPELELAPLNPIPTENKELLNNPLQETVADKKEEIQQVATDEKKGFWDRFK